MKPLMHYGRMAEKHWRKHLPQMVATLEAEGRLHEVLQAVDEMTHFQMDLLRRRLIQQGRTPPEAQARAWGVVSEKFIFLPPEK